MGRILFYEMKKRDLNARSLEYTFTIQFAVLSERFDEVHVPRLGLSTRLLYSSTFKSRCTVRDVMPNSSTSSEVVTDSLSLMNK